MPRPKKCRFVRCNPGSYYFKPRGIPLVDLSEVILSIDEFEAIRLADFQGMYQDEASVEMKISRATFGRIIRQARKKIAESIVKGKALKVEAFSKQTKKV
ncbi:MAG TPA: DUF134 domain-containing protein [Dissulfurispiraceae bacterium]|nr:DUF134 domain-containing protein [Dissulfurispiraceae bacterium]